ncbi:JAB domain-containing protein [Hahella sp. HN01]|uniref:JAB domain-containing protein n=1 Tax=Hahella sp. HN01 TaxID=2847262 RepID=UPI002112264E|nr:JAB domain-containing protein [Hahella sp. HN01]
MSSEFSANEIIHSSLTRPNLNVNDQLITYRLLQTLMLFEIPLADHIVVGGDQVVSMAAQGILGKRPRKISEPD